MNPEHNVAELPAWVQKLITDLRQDAIDDRNHIKGLVADNNAMGEMLASKKSPRAKVQITITVDNAAVELVQKEK